jgi:hypothetical protein
MDDKVYTGDIYSAIQTAEDCRWRHIIGTSIALTMFTLVVGILSAIWLCGECNKQEGVEFFFKLSNLIG